LRRKSSIALELTGADFSVAGERLVADQSGLIGPVPGRSKDWIIASAQVAGWLRNGEWDESSQSGSTPNLDAILDLASSAV
jgi:hypothetical protein